MLLIILVASLISLSLTWILLPQSVLFFGVELDPVAMLSGDFVAIVGGLILVSTALGGIYPALFMASIDPVSALKGKLNSSRGSITLRNVLMGAQLFIAVALVACALLINKQYRYVTSKSLGFDQEELMMIRVRGSQIPQKYESFKSELLKNPAFVNITSCSEPIGQEVQFMVFNAEGHEQEQFMKILNVSHDFVETLGLKVVEGRDFSPDIPTDQRQGFILNEAAVKMFGWDTGVGKSFGFAFPGADEGRVIGVVEDFHFEPLHSEVSPMVIFLGFPAWYVVARVNSTDQKAINHLSTVWADFEPDRPTDFYFLDGAISGVYEREKKLTNTFFIFSTIAIITACLGLFGIVSFLTEQKLFEVGVRKVMGAHVMDILKLMLSGYVRLAVIAAVVAIPVAYLIMDDWMGNFAYRTGIGVFEFAFAFLLVLFIIVSVATVKVQKAARVDPVQVLRNKA